MIPSTKLLRYRTYHGNNISECSNCTRYYDTAEYSYTLEIHDDMGNFTLNIEPGEIIIKDCLRTIEDRSYLYEGMEGGKILNWLLEEWNCIQHENEKQGKSLNIAVDGDEYKLVINKENLTCKLFFPTRVQEFYIDRMYEECPELAILHEGKLNEFFRNGLRKMGVKLPSGSSIPQVASIEK